MVYIQLFFGSKSTNEELYMFNFGNKLWQHFQMLHTINESRHGSKRLLIFKDLTKRSHVLIQNDGETIPTSVPGPISGD